MAALDVARGAALVAMILFHFTWDLDYFALAPAGVTASAAFKGLGDAIAATFLLIVGASLALAARHGFKPQAFVRRVLRIAGAAALITLATWFVFPNEFIFFGILHCIALSSLAAAALLRAPLSLVIVIAAIALALPIFVASPIFNAPIWWWLGLGAHQPVSNDWRPFLPWVGVVLLGLAGARVALAHGVPAGLAAWRPNGWTARALTLGGRRSLLIYLVHQPLLFGVLLLATFLAGHGLPSEASSYVRNCAAQCTEQGAKAGYCNRVCGCVATRAESTPLWRPVLEGQLSLPQRTQFNAIVTQCIGKVGKSN